MSEENPSIEYLELAALCLAIFTWQAELQSNRIVIFCDNESVGKMVSFTTSSCPNCMILIRLLTLKCLERNIKIFVRYVESKKNGIADALSRRDWSRFGRLTKRKKMEKFPSKLLKELWPIQKHWKRFKD